MPLSLPAAADLAQTAAAFTYWRSTTLVGARIPTDLLAQAVALAARHGGEQDRRDPAAGLR